jgi:hypothetical protein
MKTLSTFVNESANTIFTPGSYKIKLTADIVAMLYAGDSNLFKNINAFYVTAAASYEIQDALVGSVVNVNVSANTNNLGRMQIDLQINGSSKSIKSIAIDIDALNTTDFSKLTNNSAISNIILPKNNTLQVLELASKTTILKRKGTHTIIKAYGNFSKGDDIGVYVQNGSVGTRYGITNYTKGTSYVMWDDEYIAANAVVNDIRVKVGDNVVIGTETNDMGYVQPNIVVVKTVERQDGRILVNRYNMSVVNCTLQEYNKAAKTLN